MQVGDVYIHKKDKDLTRIILEIGDIDVIAQNSLNERTSYNKAHLEENYECVNHLNMTAHVRQRLYIDYLKSKIGHIEHELTSLKQELTEAQADFEAYEHDCTDCLAGSMTLPDCAECDNYKEALKNGCLGLPD